MTTKKYLIIGGGLAGTSLAIHLIRAGQDVTLIDSGENHSSRVAAGQINPIVFRRMNKSWRVDEFFPYAEDFYRSLETEEQTLFVNIRIRRFFSSEQEKQFWLDRQHEEEYRDYLEPFDPEQQDFPFAHNPFGSAVVKKAAFVRATKYLDAARRFIESKGTWITNTVHWDQLDAQTGSYNGIPYECIILCTGYRHRENPFFEHQKIQQTKGEILTVSAEGVPTNEALNRKCFLIPLSETQFRVGSNYKWDDATTNPTSEAREFITENAKQLLNVPFKTEEQVAGVRPTTVNRRPVAEIHPDYPKLAMLNGLGSKGYLLAPLLGKEFSEVLMTSVTD